MRGPRYIRARCSASPDAGREGAIRDGRQADVLSGEWRLGYRPGLDGLRGIAILLVLLYHSSLIPLPPLGRAGVTVFFVLSGFLITRLLIEERGRGPINLGGFYWRRARRLLPALIVMLALTLPFRPDMWWSAAWALSYAGNWWWAVGNDLGMYGHTWSLAIEEQFYLVWPLLMLAGLGLRSLLIILAALMALQLVPVSREWADFSTLTHAPSILIGAAAAFVPLERRLPPVRLAIVLAGLVAAFLLTTAAGLALAWQMLALMGLVLVVHGLAGGLSWRPLVGLGRISYSVYLWHLPVLVILGAQLGQRGPLVGVAACLLAIGIALVSYRFIERPIRDGTWFRMQRDEAARSHQAP